MFKMLSSFPFFRSSRFSGRHLRHQCPASMVIRLVMRISIVTRESKSSTGASSSARDACGVPERSMEPWGSRLKKLLKMAIYSGFSMKNGEVIWVGN